MLHLLDSMPKDNLKYFISVLQCVSTNVEKQKSAN